MKDLRLRDSRKKEGVRKFHSNELVPSKSFSFEHPRLVNVGKSSGHLFKFEGK